MSYCAPRGIPHSKFQAWDELDQDKALAWLVHENSKCPGCGQFPEEWIDEQGRIKIPTPKIARAITCYSCATVQERQRAVDNNDRETTYISLVPNPEYREP
jgi:uncharacterized Zn finger protein